jgi:hypothetical protein
VPVRSMRSGLESGVALDDEGAGVGAWAAGEVPVAAWLSGV